MIQAINTIQNKESFESFINNDYIETITNSGQRMGVAGHSVKYISNNIFELLDIKNAEITVENAKDYVVAFVYNKTAEKSEYRYYTAKIDDITAPKYDPCFKDEGVIYDNKILSGNEEILTELMSKIIQMGHISKIYKDYILHYDNYVITFIFRAEILHAGKVEYYYIQYDTNTNNVIHFLQLKQYDEEYYVLIKLDDTENGYFIDVHKFKMDSLKLYIKKCYGSDTIADDLDILFDANQEDFSNYIFNILNSDYVDYDKLTSNIFGYDTSSVIQFILNFNGPINEEDDNVYYIYHFYDIAVEHKKHDALSYSLKLIGDTPEEQAEIDAALNKIKGNLGIDINELFDFVYYVSIIDTSYEYLVNMYNKYYYTESKNKLFLAIIRQLYYSIYNSYDVVNDTILFIPGSYNFNYICNDLDELNIYYFNNINVLYTNDDTFSNKLLKNNYLVYNDKQNDDKLVDYAINIKYNIEYTNIIHTINAVKVYTYPYINQNDTWTINESDSNISTYNNLNSIHKIFVLYVEDLTNYTDDIGSAVHILNNLDNIDEKYFSYKSAQFNINPKYCSLYSDNILCNTAVPAITTNNYSYFQNTMLLIITHKNNIVAEDDDKTNYIGEYVYSLWTCTHDGYVYIKDPVTEEYALDPYGYILEHKDQNVNILYTVAKTNYTAQTPSNLNGSNFAVLRNKRASNYKISDENEFDYENDFNFIIEYVNKLNESGENTKYDSQYITDLLHISASNKLYPRLNWIYTQESQIRNIYETTTDNVQSLNRGFNILVDENNNVISEEYVSETTRQVSRNTMVEESVVYDVNSTKVERSTSQYYNEYIPNVNIPLFDTKEIFHVNTNVLNRVNILGISENAWYNGFIGTYYEDNTDKSVLGISTTNTNINIGLDTLLDVNESKKFSQYDTFKVNGFNNIKLEANKTIQTSKQITVVSQLDNDYFKSKSILPIGFAYDKININNEGPKATNVITINHLSNLAALQCYIQDIDILNSSSALFVKILYFDQSTMTTKEHICDCIYLNNLLKLECNFTDNDLTSLLPENINVDNNILLYAEYNNQYYYFLVINRNDFAYYNTSNDDPEYNTQILNSLLNIININNTTLNIRFNDSIMNEPLSGHFFVDDINNVKYAGFKHLLETGATYGETYVFEN